jgi:hypothetical protein
MAMAYTPGLKRKASTVISKTRKLPIKGKVLVKEGERISYDTEVASTNLPGKVSVLNLALILELESTSGEFEEERKSLGLSKYLLKNVGDTCEAGEVIAMRKTFFGLYQRECKVPVTGTIEYVSDVTGQCLIREPAIPLALNAYIPGTVTKVIPEEGVEIETPAALIQGIFGIGEETHGELMVLSESESDALTEGQLTEKCSGKIIVGGSIVDGPTLKKAVELGVKGIIVGGIKDADLTSFLGYSIGVAITGEFEGKLACINGATQIRAGVIRPEIIIPIDESPSDGSEDEKLHLEGLTSGLPVRIIGPPYFGAIGHVTDLPIDLQTVETESKVRVLEVELEDGNRVTVPRANVELIEE